MSDEDDPGDVAEGGRLDRTTMQTLGEPPRGQAPRHSPCFLCRRAETHPLVDSWRFEPDRLSPRSLVISLASTAYPDTVDTARTEVHWFVTGDYYFHYVETRGASHFHPPPDANGVESSPLGDHHLAVLFAVLDWVTERVETLHDDPNHSP